MLDFLRKTLIEFSENAKLEAPRHEAGVKPRRVARLPHQASLAATDVKKKATHLNRQTAEVGCARPAAPDLEHKR